MPAPQTDPRRQAALPRGIQPRCVFGGYTMAREDWTRTEDGWECDYDTDGLPGTVFPTREACEAAIRDLAAERKAA